MILGSTFYFDRTTPFPGYQALFPVVGTLLLIANCREDGLVTRKFLGNRLMVFVGTISYALYLVHWPLVVFAERYFIRERNLAEKMLVTVISFTVAVVLTYGWERPIQKRQWLPTRFRLGMFATAGVAFFLIIGFTSFFLSKPLLFPEEVESTLLTAEQLRLTVPKIASDSTGFVDASQVPALGPDPNNITAVWGDSHALVFLNNLVAPGQKPEFTYKFYVCWATAPLQGVGSVPDLERHNDEVL